MFFIVVRGGGGRKAPPNAKHWLFFIQLLFSPERKLKIGKELYCENKCTADTELEGKTCGALLHAFCQKSINREETSQIIEMK